MTNICERTHTT